MTDDSLNHMLIKKQKLIENYNQELYNQLNEAANYAAKLNALNPTEQTAEILANINRLIQLLTIL